MGEILGLGLTHYPPLAMPDENMADLLRVTLADEALPANLGDGEGWPPQLRQEYGADRGAAAAAAHRALLRAGMSTVRRALDDFAPDAVVIWGDDQYELFREPCVPAFCVLAYEDIVVSPWKGAAARRNVWGEDETTERRIRGNRPLGKALTTHLLRCGFDTAYAYALPKSATYPHAFLNTVLYLDDDRRGFDYPVVPIAVNCYGEHVITRRGGMGRLAELANPLDPDPPAPTPSRCMDLGAAIARFVVESDLRVAVIASSSWSHAFLTDKNWRLFPDHDADRRLFTALEAADYDRWRSVSAAEISASGQQELLNWFCLVGAMDEVGARPVSCELVESFAFNSNKCFAVFSTASGARRPMPAAKGHLQP